MSAKERPIKQFYEFGPFRLDAAERQLFRRGEPIALAPKALDTLQALVENAGHTVMKEDLLSRIWPNSFVEEGSLTQNVSVLRRVLGEDGAGRQYIETVPKRGYRFVAEVKEIGGEATDLILERHILAHVVAEQEEEIKPALSGRQVRAGLVSLFVLLAVGVTYFWVWRRPAPPATVAAVRSLAVLPFKPLDATRRDELLEMGMADALITRLSGIRQIVVRPLTAVRKYSTLDLDPVAAGREQGVDAVLDASIQKSGEKIRVTARRLRVGDGAALWTYQGEDLYTDLFTVQDAISEKLAGALALQLAGDEQEQLTKHYTEKTEAYQLYLKGRYHQDKRTGKEAEKSIAYFQQAIQSDPHYALAYAGLADSYAALGWLAASPPNEVIPKARAAVERALAIDERLAEAHASLGSIKHLYDWDWAGAEREFRRALELNPNSARARHWHALYLVDMGRFDEAVAESRRAWELDPLSAFMCRDVGQVLFYAHRYEQATEQLEKALELDPYYSTTYYWLAQVYEARGLYEQAIATDLQRATLSGNSPETIVALRQAYAASGWRGYWQKQLEEAKERARGGYVGPFDFVLLYVRLGNKDEAFAWLEKSFEDRNVWMPTLRNDPVLDGLRSDPRFADLLRRVGLAP